MLDAEINQKQTVEAEQAVLGSILIDSVEYGEKGILRDVLATVEESDFYIRQNRIVFRAIRYLFREGKPVDPFTIRDALASYKSEPWDNYLSQLMEITPTAANWREYANIMREKAVMRRIQSLTEQITQADTVEDCRPLIASLVETVGTGKRVEAWNMADLFQDFLNRQEKPVDGFKFGFSELDKVTLPEKGDYCLIAAEPDGGKTAFSIQCAYQMAAMYKVGYFTLETIPQDIGDRSVSSATGVSYGKIKRHEITEESDWEAIANIGVADYAKRDLTVIKADGYAVTKIRAVSQAFGFQIVFIDYAQLVESESGNERMQEQCASVSRAIKSFGRNTGILIVATAQLTRPKGEWREPNMHDIAGSSQFEKDADLMMFLYKPNPDECVNPSEERILKIGKNKKGIYGRWDLFFDGDRQRFSFVENEY